MPKGNKYGPSFTGDDYKPPSFGDNRFYPDLQKQRDRVQSNVSPDDYDSSITHRDPAPTLNPNDQ
jgi:hypothetical protein